MRTEKLIALAEEVANRPLPLQTRVLLPAILTIVGIGAFWLGFRDDDKEPGPPALSTVTTPIQTTTSSAVATPP